MSYLKRVEKQRERNRAIEEDRKAQQKAATAPLGVNPVTAHLTPEDNECQSGFHTDDRYKSRASRAAAARDLDVAKATGKLPPKMASALLAASMAAQRELGPLKLLAILTLGLGLAGCNEITDPVVPHHWVVERHGRSPSEIQADYDALARNGWWAEEDDDLQKSGHYVYFTTGFQRSKRDEVLKKTQADLNAGRAVGK